MKTLPLGKPEQNIIIKSPYDVKGIKFGSAKLSIRREFEVTLPIACNFIQIEPVDNYSKAPLLIYNYENNDRTQAVKFMWAGETETVDPGRIERYVGFCRIQGAIQHLLILK